MSASRLIVSRNPVAIDPHLLLGDAPGAGCDFTLLQWELPAWPEDGGDVPGEIGGVLGRASAGAGRVTFAIARASPQDAVAGDVVRQVPAHRLVEQVTSGRMGAGSAAIVSTVRPQRIVEYFAQDWSDDGLFALFSTANGRAPDIRRTTYEALSGREWAADATRLASEGVLGVLRAGVDGAVAGLLVLDAAFGRRFLDMLEQEARAARLEWRVIAGDDRG